MRARIEQDLKVKAGRYMSYLLRHDPGNLKMDEHGFVEIDGLVEKLKERFQIDKESIYEIVEKSGRRRFEIVGTRIRALYGHTIPVELELKEEKAVKVLYHGTTPEAASKILEAVLEPMKRRRVHLSPTVEIAREVGLRRTRNPVILEVDVEEARRDGIRFYKATDKVYVCNAIPRRYIACAQW